VHDDRFLDERAVLRAHGLVVTAPRLAVMRLVPARPHVAEQARRCHGGRDRTGDTPARAAFSRSEESDETAGKREPTTAAVGIWKA
jgi:hypothetical protein